jgi:ubiquitin thioesterase protein OTUB1
MNSEKYFPFVDNGWDNYDMATFCIQEVEPMGRECDQVHIMALTEALGIQVEIEYLDGRYVTQC